MASRLVANDNRLAEIGDRLTPREFELIKVFRSLSPYQKALVLQEADRIVPLPGDR
jgi:hypothetical protein